MRKMFSILSLYQQHQLFIILGIVLVSSMAAIQFLSTHGYGFYVEDLMTIWFAIWMSLAFQLGIMIKRQAANPMAHLLPGYRWSNAFISLTIWTVIVTITSTWLVNMFSFISPFKARIALGLLCVGTFLVTTLVAYISIRFLVLISYALLLLAVAHVMNILDVFIQHPIAFGICAGGLGLLLVIFVWRIATLKEENWEYSYLLSWPLYKNNCEEGRGHKNKPYIKQTLPSFNKLKSSWKKTLHWASVDSENTSSLIVVLLAAVLLYEFYVLKIVGTDGFYMRPYSNLFLFTMLPVSITLFSNHRLFAYKDWALMLPLGRKELAQQWGNLLTLSFISIWSLICVLFAFVPSLLLKIDLLNSIKMWEFLALTGVYGYMTLSWFCYIAMEQNSKKVIAYILFYFYLTSFEFLALPFLNEKQLLLQIIIFLVAGIWYRQKAYQKWGKEDRRN